MADEVVITMTAQDAAMVAAWQRARKGPEGVEEALAKLGRKSKQTQGELKAAFDVDIGGKITDALRNALNPMTALTTATQLFKAELDAVIQRQERIANRQIDIAPAFRRAAAVGRELTPDSMFQQVARVAAGQEQARDLFLTYEAATSAAGPTLSGQDILDAVLMSAKQRPDLDQNSRIALTTGALQLQKTFGTDVATSMAAVQQSFGTSRAENLASFSKYMIPTVVGLRQMGGGKDSFEELMSLAVGFGLSTNDPTGEQTRTNLINLAKQVKEKSVANNLTGADASIMEMFQAVQRDPTTQQQLLGVFAKQAGGKSAAELRRDIAKGEMSIGAAQFQTGVELLTGDMQSATMRNIAGARQANLGLTPAAVAEIERSQAAINESRALITPQLAAQGERIATGSELLSGQGLRAQARALRAKALEQQPARSPAEIAGRAADYALSEFAGLFESEERFAARQAAMITQTPLRENRAVTQEQAALATAILEAAAKMEASNREVADLLREQTTIMQRPQPVKIEADNRANVVPRRAPVGALKD